jgi:hypothetical protein
MNKKFKPFKLVCQQCITNYGDRVWDERDEKEWGHSYVRCPHMPFLNWPSRKFCLKTKEVDAISDGYVFVWDHIRV